MLTKLDQIQATSLQALQSVSDEDTLQAWRVTHTGRSSALMQVFSTLGQLSKEERPLVGQKANLVKLALEAAFNEHSQVIRETALNRSLEMDHLDVSLPGRPPRFNYLPYLVFFHSFRIISNTFLNRILNRLKLAVLAYDFSDPERKEFVHQNLCPPRSGNSLNIFLVSLNLNPDLPPSFPGHDKIFF